MGSKSFVTSFRLGGIRGIISTSSDEAFDQVTNLTDNSDVGLVLISDDIAAPITDKLTQLRADKGALVFALPAAGSAKTEMDYRLMLKKILGV